MIEAESREEFLSNRESTGTESSGDSKAIAELKEQLLLMKSMVCAIVPAQVDENVLRIS